MKEQNLRVRIINKSKEGITLKTNGMKVLMSWEEFNKYWVMSEDKLWATATDELEKEMSEIEDIKTQAVIAARRVNVLNSKPELVGDESREYLTQSLVLGDCIEKLDKKLGEGNGIKEVLKMYQKMFGPNGALTGFTTDAPARRKNRTRMMANAEQRRREREEENKKECNSTSTNALGDFFSDDAKKKLGLI